MTRNLRSISVGVGVLIGGSLCVSMGGCEQKAPPASAANPTSTTPLGGLRENPTSIPGKSAAMARNAARDAAGAQDQASNLANEISGGGKVTVGPITFSPPKDFQSVQPPNRMQAAALKGPGDVAVAFFTNIGGDLASNINRWKQQVTNPETNAPADSTTKEETIQGMKVTFVSMQGTYASMTGGASQAQPNTGFRGAAIQTPGGGTVFVRMTGPIDAVKNADAAFRSMIGSMQK